MSRRTLTARAENFALATPFAIARGVRLAAEVIVVEIAEDGTTGRGEATPLPRYGESQASTLAQIEAMAPDIEAGLDRAGLQPAMAPGAARNAVDLALWDLEAKLGRTTAWAIAGIVPPSSIATAYTISLGEPEAMAAAALVHRARPVLKLKLGGDGADGARIAAVRAALPAVRLIADANESLREASLDAVIEAALRHGVELIEQPLPAGADACLAQRGHGVLMCADESCHTRADLDTVARHYGAVNIKLDKAGGLTEALALAGEARARGLVVMVGCMISTSLGIAPAQLIAADAAFVDLDAPLYLAGDRDNAIAYDSSTMAIAAPALWG